MVPVNDPDQGPAILTPSDDLQACDNAIPLGNGEVAIRCVQCDSPLGVPCTFQRVVVDQC